eukprot:gene8199-16858_t
MSKKPKSKGTRGSINSVSDGDSVVKRNSNGGVLVTNEELRAAFEFLDIDQTGRISLGNLKGRLGVFFPEYSSKDYRFLMNNKRDLTFEDLSDMLMDNDITNFDPVAEAFKAYDINSEGHIPGPRIKDIFRQVGLGDLTNEEVAILTRAADADGDGEVSLEDFRFMVDIGKTIP